MAQTLGDSGNLLPLMIGVCRKKKKEGKSHGLWTPLPVPAGCTYEACGASARDGMGCDLDRSLLIFTLTPTKYNTTKYEQTSSYTHVILVLIDHLF